MAQKVQVLLVDDLNGGEADETVAFAFEGKTYEIDLSKKNAEKFRRLMAPYTAAGRKTGNARGQRKTARQSSNEDTAAIRNWARENGYEVNDRGRVPASIREAYAKANG